MPVVGRGGIASATGNATWPKHCPFYVRGCRRRHFGRKRDRFHRSRLRATAAVATTVTTTVTTTKTAWSATAIMDDARCPWDFRPRPQPPVAIPGRILRKPRGYSVAAVSGRITAEAAGIKKDQKRGRARGRHRLVPGAPSSDCQQQVEKKGKRELRIVTIPPT